MIPLWRSRRSRRSAGSFRRFLGFLRPHWRLGAIGGVIMLISVGLQLPMPLLTMYLIDHVVVDRQVLTLHLIGFALLGFLVLKAFATYWQNYVLLAFRNRVMFDVRRRTFLHLERLPQAFFDTRRVGYLTSRLTSDINQVEGLLASTFLSALRQSVTLVVGVVLVFWLNWKLALMSVAILPFFIIWIRRLNPRVRELRRRSQEEYGVATGDLLETLSNIYLVKSFTAERRELTKMLRSLRQALRTDFRAGVTSTALSVGAISMSSLGKLALIWVGCLLIIRGELTIGAFLAFNSFLKYLFDPAEGLVTLNLSTQQSLAAVDRVYELLDEPAEPRATRVPERRPVHGDVEFRDVSFSYDGTTPLLQGVDLHARPGTSVAIVGASGAGKSTLVKLLLRLHEPQEGTVLIDGEDIRGWPLSTLRRQIGLVPQDTFLFSGSVWDNLRYGKPKATQDELLRCAKLANAHDFILELPNGYDTQIGERGVRLSGGQKQRLSIAMAFVKDAPILVLDEATASVDNLSEEAIQQAMARLMERRTTFIIAHRLSTIRDADLIVVLDGGRIVESGDHDTLIETTGAYRRMYFSGAAA